MHCEESRDKLNKQAIERWEKCIGKKALTDEEFYADDEDELEPLAIYDDEDDVYDGYYDVDYDEPLGIGA